MTKLTSENDRLRTKLKVPRENYNSKICEIKEKFLEPEEEKRTNVKKGWSMKPQADKIKRNLSER